MINLMPDNAKRQLRAARANTILIRYTVIILIAFAFVLMILAGSYILLTQTKTSAEELIAANDTSALQYSTTQNEINGLSSTLQGARTILDQQLSYSKTMRLIGQSMPPGTVIESLTLNDSSFNGAPVSIRVFATSADLIPSLTQNFQRSGSFESVNTESINEQSGIPGYPVSATLTFSINRTAAQ